MDRRATQPLRLAAAVPVLVQVEDGVADRAIEAGLSCDRGPAFAADLLDLAAFASTVDADRDQPTETQRQRLGRRQVRIVSAA